MALVHGVDVLDQGLLVHYPLGEPIVVGIDTCCLFLLGWEVQTGDADRAADRSDPLELMRSGRSITRYFFLCVNLLETVEESLVLAIDIIGVFPGRELQMHLVVLLIFSCTLLVQGNAAAG